MNEKKIAVIAQREKLGHSAIWSHLSKIDIPKDYEVDLIEVPSGGAVADAYQRAMEQSDAKYKVYLSSGSILLRSSFFLDMLRIFVQDRTIGIIGVVGTEQLSTTGLFKESPFIKGELLYDDDSRFEGEPVSGEMEDVMVIGSDLIATQYDIPWRKDLFRQDCFWAEAQCVEFRRKGYRVVVPRQERAWLLTSKRDITYDEVSLETFLDTYSKDIYPLVSIIIPTYQRPHYFRLALESVLAQTYRNLDIFITDDSNDTETAEMMRHDFADDSRIHYEHHPSYGAAKNWRRAQDYNNPDAVYVNWLMDDDLFMPDKIAIMVNWMLANPDVSMVTSYRECIDADGKKISDLWYTKAIVQVPTKFTGEKAGGLLLHHLANFIGEPTTVLIRKKFLLDGHNLGFTGKEGKYLTPDFPTWLHLLSQGDMVYLPTPLSQFRLHEGNDQSKFSSQVIGMIGWAMAIRDAIARGMYLHDMVTIRESILRWLRAAVGLLHNVDKLSEVWEITEVQDLISVIIGMSEALCKDCQIKFHIDTTLVLQPMEDGI